MHGTVVLLHIIITLTKIGFLLICRHSPKMLNLGVVTHAEMFYPLRLLPYNYVRGILALSIEQGRFIRMCLSIPANSTSFVLSVLGAMEQLLSGTWVFPSMLSSWYVVHLSISIE